MLMCDGFSSFVAIAKATAELRLAHCWAHVRRSSSRSKRLSEGRRAHHAPDRSSASNRATSRTRREHDERRRRLRKRRSTVVLRAIQLWCLDVRCTPGSRLAQAIKYMTDRWTPTRRSPCSSWSSSAAHALARDYQCDREPDGQRSSVACTSSAGATRTRWSSAGWRSRSAQCSVGSSGSRVTRTCPHSSLLSARPRWWTRVLRLRRSEVQQQAGHSRGGRDV